MYLIKSINVYAYNPSKFKNSMRKLYTVTMTKQINRKINNSHSVRSNINIRKRKRMHTSRLLINKFTVAHRFRVDGC